MGTYSYKSTPGMLAAIKESNDWGANLHMAVHTNGFNSQSDADGNFSKYGTATGSRPMYYSTGYGKPIVDKILEWRAKIYPRAMKSSQNQELAELRDTKATAVYEELVFHDNPEDAAWLHTNMQKMAEYTARALCEHYQYTFVDPFAQPEPAPEPTPSTGSLYRVQVGAFRNRTYAQAMADKLMADGYPAYIREEK